MLCASVVFYCLLRSSQIYMNWSMVNRSCPESDFKHCNSWRLNMFKVCPLPHNLATTYTRLPHDWSNNYFRSGKWSQAWQIGVVRDPGTHAAWYDRQPSEMMIRSDICICTPGSARPAPGRKFGKFEWLEEINCLWSVQKQCWSCEVHQRMSKWLLRCQWNDMKESVHNWVNEPMNRWTDEPMNQWISQSMNQWINEATKQWLNESSDQWTNESINQWNNDSMNQWFSKSVNQWINEPLNQWTKEPMNQWMKKFSRRHLPKVLHCPQFFAILCETELSLQSGAHFADLIFQKCPDPFSLFCDFYVKLSSCYSLVHIFQKCSAHLSLLAFWSAKRALATVLCAFRRQLLQFEPRTCGNRDPPLATTEVILPEKKHRVSRPRVFSPVNSCAAELLHVATWWWMVHMMMWLTWWCKCRPWQSSVTRKFANETSFGYMIL